MREETITPNRLIAFAQGVFAMIVTVMVLELEGGRLFSSTLVYRPYLVETP
jgi:uncharacterized membrane protein